MNTIRTTLLLACALPLAAATAAQAADQRLAGRIASSSGQKLDGVTVSAKLEGSTITTSVYTDAAGEYFSRRCRRASTACGRRRSASRPARARSISPRHAARIRAAAEITDPERRFRQLPGEMMVAALPEASAEDAHMKKIFMNNCTGCHSTSYALQFRFDEAGWSKIIDLMKIVPVTGVYPGPNAKPNQIIERNQKQLAAYLATRPRPGRVVDEGRFSPAPDRRGRARGLDALRRAAQSRRRHRHPIQRRTTAPTGRWARPPSSASCRTTAAWASTARSTSRSTTRTAP